MNTETVILTLKRWTNNKVQQEFNFTGSVILEYILDES
jgi:hypothetical protein